MVKQLGVILAAVVGKRVHESLNMEDFKNALITHPDLPILVPIICDSIEASTTSEMVLHSASLLRMSSAAVLASGTSEDIDSLMRIFSNVLNGETTAKTDVSKVTQNKTINQSSGAKPGESLV